MPDNQDSFKLHVAFQKIELQFRKKSGGAPKRIIKDNIHDGPILSSVVKELQNDFEEALDDMPPEFDPALIFRIKIEDKEQISDDVLRQSGLVLLSEEDGNFVVLFSPDQLLKFQDRIGVYSQPKEEGRKTLPYSWIAALTNEMNLWGPEDRKGTKLSQINIVDDQEYILDVELWIYGQHDEQLKRMDELKSFINNNEGAFLDSLTNSFLNISRVKVSGNVLNRLLTVGIIERIDIPPQPDLRIGEFGDTRIDDFPNTLSPSDDSPGICIIDSGILSGHPFLSTAIAETSAIPARLGSGVDQHGHGTRVAGIALYGDVSACIDNLNFRPELFLFGARVTNAANKFDDTDLIEKQMEEAISYYHSQYGCRIFNISLADPYLVYEGGRPSSWAQTLDMLAHNLNILIVVSAGNLGIMGVLGAEAARYQKSYPHYLLDPKSRILEPATAANVLTVGALAHSVSTSYAARYPNDPAARPMADINEPSPFTRSGPGVNGSIKPDICEYGGNLMFDGRMGIRSDRGLGIVSMNHKLNEGPFNFDVGTSFAAPRVAHIAGRILKQYPNISANLIRALIANSAKPPIEEGKLTKDEILQVCGYGQPDLERAIYSTDNRVTLTADDQIELNKVHIYKIPIPESFKSTNGKRSITVTLAFDPPVRNTRKGYLGIKMEYQLVRGLSTDQVQKQYEYIPRDQKRESAPPFKFPTFPSFRKRSAGTLQKTTWLISRNGTIEDYGDEDIHLVVVCSATQWISRVEFDKQRYALAVTLEHLGASLYNVIEQKVKVRPEQRVRVR